MHRELGQTLRCAREAQGWEQSDVSASLGVGQQAVSGWERGKSRPRRAALRRVADLFGLDEDHLIEVGRYADDSTGARRNAAPTRPRTRTLPLGDLPPERFEDLVTEIIQALHPDGHASRFGGSGEKQFGIDVLVTSKVGNLATGQCKRHVVFGPAAVSSAVADVSIDAENHYLFLARLTATAAARAEMARWSKWQLWDGEDTARFIRTKLPPHEALRIVDTYFPGHREPFLGVAQPGPWLAPEEFFLPAVGQIFSQDWDLVGRSEQVDQLVSALYGTAGTLAALIGRGGLGKTRVLRAVGSAAHGATRCVRLLRGGDTVSPADFELLPDSGRIAIMIDDAHECDDLAHVIAGIRRRNADASILIATRPYGWHHIRSELGRAAALPDAPAIVELGDLSFDDAVQLAHEALGDRANEGDARRLARLTLDCPLITVVGGVLVRRGLLDLDDLPRDDDVRREIMLRFQDALVYDPLVTDQATRAAVLDALSALQPFRTDDPEFQAAVSELAGQPFDVVLKHLRSLEDGGVLYRRGASVRIVPDLLGDAILSRAAYDDRAHSGTGYLDRVRRASTGQAVRHLFVNASRVDWQVGARAGTPPSLTEALWEPLEEELRQGDISRRLSLIRLLTRVAYFQPTRVIALGRWLLDHPTDLLLGEELNWPDWMRPTYDNVIHELPGMLKGAAYRFETLSDVLRLLWELARVDDRPTNQHPDHPLRVLKDLAAYTVAKPLAYNAAVVDVVSEWVSQANKINPLDVLEPILATEGSNQTTQGYTLTFNPFAINVEAVAPLRQQVIELALDEVKSSDVARAVAGVAFISVAVRYPSGMFGREVASEERDRWTEGFVSIIEQLGETLLASQVDPVVVIAAQEALDWHAMHSSTRTRDAAAAVLQTLPQDDLKWRIALAIHDGWGRIIRRRNRDYEAAEELIRERLDEAIQPLLARPDADIIAFVGERIAIERSAFRTNAGTAGPLIGRLVEVRPTLVPIIIRMIEAGSAVEFEPLLPVILSTYATTDADAAIDLAEALLSSGSQSIVHGVAQALGWNRAPRPMDDREFKLMVGFASHPDNYVRLAAATAAFRLANEQPQVACDLIASIEFSDDPNLAGDVFMCFSDAAKLTWEMFRPDQQVKIAERLVAVPDIGEYWIAEFLAARAAAEPAWFIQLVCDRIRRAEKFPTLGDYRATPFEWTHPLNFAPDRDLSTELNKLLAWIAEAPQSWIRREMGAELFAELVKPVDALALNIIAGGLASPSIDLFSVSAAVLSKLNRSFAWDHVDFVTEALESGARFGEEGERKVRTALWGATISGVRTGTPGEPFPEDVEQRDRARECADRLPRGSRAEIFYRDMERSAIADIKRATAEDQLDDGRDW